MKKVKVKIKSSPADLRLSPEKRIANKFDADSIAEFPIADAGEMGFLSSGFPIIFQKVHKSASGRKIQAAVSTSKAIASFSIKAFTTSSCVRFALSDGSALTMNVVPPIFSTKQVSFSFTVITPFHRRTGHPFPNVPSKTDI